MPNWIEGAMKVRGDKQDVIRFFEKAFTYYRLESDKDGNFINVPDESKIGIYRADEYIEIEIPEDSHLEGTNRAFASKDIYVYINHPEVNEECTVAVPLRQAWTWREDEFKDLSDKYNVDIRLVGWEQGCEFKATVESLRGEEPEYMEFKFADWNWDADMPFLGG